MRIGIPGCCRWSRRLSSDRQPKPFQHPLFQPPMDKGRSVYIFPPIVDLLSRWLERRNRYSDKDRQSADRLPVSILC